MEIQSPEVLPTPDHVAMLERLGDEIAELSAHIDAATAHLLDLIRAFDAREGWGHGFRSCADWLRYRQLGQALFSRPRLLSEQVRDEGTAMRGDAVDGVKQLPHRGDQRDLWELATRDETIVVRAKPRVVSHGHEDGHPELGAEVGVADGREPCSR